MNRAPARLLVLLGLALLIVAPTRTEAKVPATTIRSLESDETVTVASEDVARLGITYGFSPSSERFWQTDLSPQPLAALPVDPGPAFEVVDGYWDELARHHQLPGTAEENIAYGRATYYPATGIVELSSGSGDQFWFQLDSGRNAFLRRYVVLLEQGFTDPSSFDVLQVARETRREWVDVRLRVDGQMMLLDADQADRFWPEFLSATARAELVPADFEGGEGTHFGRRGAGYWPVYRDQDVRIELTLPEGRRVEYTLFRPEAFLARAPEGWGSWPARNAPPELLSVIDELVGPPRVNHRAAPEPDAATISEPARPPLRTSPLVRAESEPLPPQSTALASIEIAGAAILAAVLISVTVGWLVTRRRATR